MTGQNIQKHGNGSWTFLNHEELEIKCRLFQISTFLQRRRETLKEYRDTYREELLQEAMEITK